MNFYVTLIGGFGIARWDSFFVRLFRRPLLSDLLSQMDNYDDKPATLNYYGSLLYSYGKNVFYYKHASENVRSGKHKFFVPYKSNFKNTYSNMMVLRLFDQNFLATILQDINIKDVKIYVKNKSVLDLFKVKFGEEISQLVKKSSTALIKSIYGDIDGLLSSKFTFVKILAKFLTHEDVSRIKDGLYYLDFWVARFLVKDLLSKKVSYSKVFSDLSIIWILANLRETLLWFLLYITYLRMEQATKKRDLKIQMVFYIYIRDVLWITPDLYQEFHDSLESWYRYCEEILKERIILDDNHEFLKLISANWKSFVAKKTINMIKKSLVWEDIIWFRWLLKNITYYNKRFLIPKW